jgi:hypothetical protein
MERWLGSLVIAAVFGGPSITWAAEPQDPEQMYLLGATPGVQGSPRVRGSSLEVARAMEDAWEQSPTFRQLVATISSTDGIVYVHHDTCGRNVLACLLLGVTQAGAHRILHIRVDKRRTGRDLMVSIGHELQHAIELLSEPGVVDTNSARLFYERVARTERYFFETEAAIETELKVDRELRAWTRQQRGHDASGDKVGVKR